MNVSLKKSDDALSGVITVEIESGDYAENVKKSLQSLRQKANMPGFRRGMTPPALIKKLYGKAVLDEELNKILANAINNYIKDNSLDIMGYPMQSKEQKTHDLDVDENFSFDFDVALTPVINVELTKADHLTYYKIKVADDEVESRIETYRTNFGEYVDVEAAGTEDLLKGRLAELNDEKAEAEDGIIIDEQILSPKYMKDKTEQKKFDGVKVGETVVYNPYKACDGNPVELRSMLRTDKEKVEDKKADFSFTVKEIKHLEKAELGEEFYQKVFGKEEVKDEADFREKIRQSLVRNYASESENRLAADIHRLLTEKSAEVQFAEDLLKRFLIFNNAQQEKPESPESLEEKMPAIIEALKYQTVRDHLAGVMGVKVEQADIEDVAKQSAAQQLMQYGLYKQINEETLQKYADNMLQKQEFVNKFADIAIENKLYPLLKEKVTIEEKEVSIDEFYNTNNE